MKYVELLPGAQMTEPWPSGSGPVSAIATTPENSEIITGSVDGTVRIWNRDTGLPVFQPLAGHAGPVHAIAVTPDGSQIITGSDDGTVRVWDRGTGRAVGAPIRDHAGAIRAVAVTPDQAHILSGGEDGRVRRWDLQSGRLLADVSDHDGPVSAVAISPHSPKIIVGHDDGSAAIVDRNEHWPLSGHTGAVRAIAVTPDGTQIITGSDDGTVRISDFGSGLPASEPLTGHAGPIVAIAVTSDGTQIIVASRGGSVRIWDRATGLSAGEPLIGTSSPLSALTVVPDGTEIIAVCSGEIAPRGWSLDVPQDRVVIGPLTPGGGRTGSVDLVALFPGSSQIITAGLDGAVRVWRGSGTPSVNLSAHDGPIRSIAVTPDGTQIITGGDNGKVRLWRANGSFIANLVSHKSPVLAIAVSPDGRQIVTGSDDGAVRIWDRDPENSAVVVWKRDSDYSPVVLIDHGKPVRAAVVTPDGRQIITGGDDRAVRIWDRGAAAPVGRPLTGHTRSVMSIAVTPDGQQIVSGSADGSVRIWNRKSGLPAGEPLIGHAGPVRAIAITPDGSKIITGSDDGTVRIWDRVGGTPVSAPLIGHTGAVSAVVTTPDGTQIITGSADGTVRIWACQRQATTAVQAAEIQSDTESEIDQLGISTDVAVLAAMLAATSTRPPLSIALMGDWGSGKSTFIHHLRRKVSELVDTHDDEEDLYVSTVRQVRFNAWHYSDDHLWVGLIEEIFGALRSSTDPTNLSIAAKRSDTAAVEAELAHERAQKTRQDRALAEIDKLDEQRWWSWLGQAQRSLLIAQEAGRDAGRELRTRTVRIAAVWAILFVAAVSAGVWLTPWLSGLTAQVASTSSWIAALITAIGLVVAPIRTAWSTAISYSESARKQLLLRRADRTEKIASLESRLRSLDPIRQLDQLLADLANVDRYQNYRGLTGRIHRDLQALSDQLTAASRDKPSEAWRIILYIDDLDRCTPARVAEILQAVNLLLTMRLFLVVVAVDPRWLLRALNEHHGGLLTGITPDSDGREGERAGVGGALDYLDKIFHLPYAMRPMRDRGSDMLRALLPATEQQLGEQSTGDSYLYVAPTPRHALRDINSRPRTPESAADNQTTNATERATRPLHSDPPGVTPVGPQIRQPNRPRVEPVADDNQQRMIFTSLRRNSTASDIAVALEQLHLSQAEADFLPKLGPLLPTPRAVKKFTNLYRLVRIGVPPHRLESYIGSEGSGPFHAPALLLAALISVPGAAPGLLREISDAADPNSTILDSLAGSENSAALFLCRSVSELQRVVKVHTSTRSYQLWAPTTARYSFETYDFFNAPV